MSAGEVGASVVLAEIPARELLGSAVPLVPSRVVYDEAELLAVVAEMGDTVVLKAAAPWLIHKSDLGLVRIGIRAGAAVSAFRDLMSIGREHGGIDGVIVQPQLEGHEMLVGLRRDPRLGAFLVVGMGGVDVETLRDVGVVPADATRAAIRAAIRGLRGAAILGGQRGRRPADLAAVVEIARCLGKLAGSRPEIAAVDLNPVVVGPASAVAVDARVVLGPRPEPLRRSHHDLSALFSPRSIAIVGASSNPTKLGARALRYLVDGGYAGAISAVHPTESALHGVPVSRSISAIEPPPDLVSVIVGSPLVPAVVDECIAAGVRTVIIHSGEFGRTRSEARAQAATLARASSSGTLIVGPNSMGVMAPADGVYASFAGVLEAAPFPGGAIALVSQSGALGSTLLSRAADEGFGFSRWLSTGNEMDADFADALAYLADDPATALVVGYIESVRRGPAFRDAARRLHERGKPLVLYQGGRSALGRDVVASHTGMLTPTSRLVTAFLDAAGAVRAPTLASMLTAAMVIERQGVPRGPRTVIVTMSGAAAGICADLADTVGLDLARLGPATRARLSAVIPASGRIRNPIDVTAHAMTDPSRLISVIDALIDDPGVDQIVIQLTTNADPAAEVMASAIVERTGSPADRRKTLLVSRLGSPRLAPQAVELFRRNRIPVLTWPDEAVAAAYVTGQVGQRIGGAR